MRKFQQESERVESGAIKFGDDWPGLFLRGDDAFAHSLSIITVWEYLKNQNMPLTVYLAMLQLAGVSDDIQTQVVVGGKIAREISDEVRSKLCHGADTIQQPTQDIPTEQTNE